MRTEEFEVVVGSPLALAISRARAAAERRDAAGMAGAYPEAVRLARASAALRDALAVEHVTRLRALGDSAGALAHCDTYLSEHGDSAALLLVRAETDLTRGDHSRVQDDLAAVRRVAGGRPRGEADALLSRLEGLAEARGGRLSSAERHLRRAHGLYSALGDEAATAVVADDLRIVAARQDARSAGRTPSTGRPAGAGRAPSTGRGTPMTRSPHARLTRSEELRVVGRYEEALAVLDPALAGPLDPALRFFFLEARVRLLRLLRDDDTADGVVPELHRAAGESARPAENRVAARRLERSPGPEALATGDHHLQHIRWLVKHGDLAAAEELLPAAEHVPAEPDERHAAEWNLAMAEFLHAVARRTGKAEIAGQAVAHGERCLRYADSVAPVRVAALRLLGHTHKAFGRPEDAVRLWADAHRAEEAVAALQPSDHVRLRMLHAVPTEFDEQVLWACEQAAGAGGRAAALVAIAVEAARGAQVLPRVRPDHPPRALPEPGDVAGARRWVRRAVRGMPRSQVVWMLHATQHDVHHVLVERTPWDVRVRHEVRRCDRHRLVDAIDAMAACLAGGGARWLAGQPPGTTEFDDRLVEIADLLGVPGFLELPRRVTRIAVVAGGELADIPFALLPLPGADGALIGRRYALSSLPCLALRTPLRRRARGQRGTCGEQMLVLRGPARDGQPISPAAHVPGRVVLDGAAATAAGLRAALGTGAFRQVRIDSHGTFGDDASQAALFLVPGDGGDGRLGPGEFQGMDLGATGTLALGACETGMAERIGRDERAGFVRAGFLSGASAVLAARWEALDEVAARVLDRFEQLLDRHPRDVALFLAQREEDTADGHPTRWAALTLHGDTGHQTDNDPLARWHRRRWPLAAPTGPAPNPGEQR
ncbi:CHAT domain-containing protein [Saccharothrix syringae]|uniref:CHAT domain-containing protein n=1 Tax=Saccharothrix syringae TaxID=103733 RepID=A0A5Q0H1H2_SACSY|nr:CHAT domain-containing protein [Saccharothrix syringae]QFZ19630.1 CHAT domain-containing protein [Saccharothrix syringae]